MGAVKMLGLGECPPGYNPKVHGPYDPAINYGKKDIPLGQVKISELPGWLARRNWTPAGIAGFIHWCVGICFVSYMASYGKFQHHRVYKYHCERLLLHHCSASKKF